MKRWATRKRICVFLLLLAGGAIINVAVAWGCVFAHDPKTMNVRASSEEQRAFWDSNKPSEFSEDCRFGGQQRAFGVQRDKYVSSHAYSDSKRYGKQTGGYRQLYLEFADSLWCGWPFLSLNGTVWTQSWPGKEEKLLNGLWRHAPDRYLPLHPAWAGLMGNTLFYAGVLWLLFAAPFVLRRRRRVKRGLCPACAYPIGDSAVCTECGKPVTPKKVAA